VLQANERQYPGPGRRRRRGLRRFVRPHPIEARTTQDFTTALFRKLTVNSAGGICGIVNKPNGVSRDPAIAEIMLDSGRGMRRHRAGGRGEAPRRISPLRWCAATKNASPESINSLHADRMAGRPMEIDARHGIIVRLAKSTAFPTPMNKTRRHPAHRDGRGFFLWFPGAGRGQFGRRNLDPGPPPGSANA